MQLYSSVLNSEQIKAEEESSNNNKKFAIPKALSDLKTTLRENIDKKREALKRTFSEDFEADAPESLHETVILEKRLSPGSVGSNPVRDFWMVRVSDVADTKKSDYCRISKSHIRIGSDTLKFQIVRFGYPKSQIFSSNTLKFC